MRKFTHWTKVDPSGRGAVAAIGNFDGVHIGHQAVIDAARQTAKDSAAPLGIVTFEPHPREVFAPKSPPFRLMNAETRSRRLEKLGVDCLYELPFDSALASLTPEAFAREVVADGLGLAHVVVGEDFRFGKARAGNVRDLEAFGSRMGFGVSALPLVEADAVDISSTSIREALSDGRPRSAAAMLGHWHRVDGPVIHGEKRGRGLGYPTANMSIAGLHLPRFGVYAVKADVLDGAHKGSYGGAASIGIRPMFGENRPNLETYIFDFDGDLYGARLSIALVEFLRPERKFNAVDDLVSQMAADCDQARRILAEIS